MFSIGILNDHTKRTRPDFACIPTNEKAT